VNHEYVLRAVIKRAYEDLSLLYKKPHDEESQRLAENARLWIFGISVSKDCSSEGSDLDEFMSLRSLCESLRLPYYEMIAYADKVVRGEHEQFRESKRVIVWSTDEYSRGAVEHNIGMGARAESFLRAERTVNTGYNNEYTGFRESYKGVTRFGD